MCQQTTHYHPCNHLSYGPFLPCSLRYAHLPTILQLNISYPCPICAASRAYFPPLPPHGITFPLQPIYVGSKAGYNTVHGYDRGPLPPFWGWGNGRQMVGFPAPLPLLVPQVRPVQVALPPPVPVQVFSVPIVAPQAPAASQPNQVQTQARNATPANPPAENPAPTTNPPAQPAPSNGQPEPQPEAPAQPAPATQVPPPAS